MHHAVPLPFWMLQSKHISTWTCILDILNESLFVSGKEAVGSFGANMHSTLRGYWGELIMEYDYGETEMRSH